MIKKMCVYVCVVFFSRQVMSDSLQPRGLQHARLFCVYVCVYICVRVCINIYVYERSESKSQSVCVQLFVTPWTIAHQALLSMEFSGKNTGVGSHSLLQGIFPT